MPTGSISDSGDEVRNQDNRVRPSIMIPNLQVRDSNAQAQPASSDGLVSNLRDKADQGGPGILSETQSQEGHKASESSENTTTKALTYWQL